MNSRIGREYFEALEREHEALLAAKKAEAALRAARLLYVQTPQEDVRHGIGARGIAAACTLLRRHREAWQWASEAWNIHNEQLQQSHDALHVLGERAVSGAYAGAAGVLLVLSPERGEDAPQVKTHALTYTRMALRDFEAYRASNQGRPHRLEALSMSRISMGESILGEPEKGRTLAHQTFDLVESAEGVFGGEQREMDAERLGAFGAMVVATTGDLLESGGNLYDTVREIV